MPNYDYECRECGKESERALVPINDRDNQTCEVCEGELRRLITFFGSVWAPTSGGMR